jgi:hypothetical protein
LEFTSKIKQQEKQEKQEKTEETEKGPITITEKRVTIWSFQGICIRHWLKRVTMAIS